MYSATLPEYGTIIIRYPRGNGEGVKWRNTKFSPIPYGKAELLHQGEKIAVLSIGTVGNKASKAVMKAEKEGLNVLHYNMRFLKPIDEDALKDACDKADTIITVEDGTVIGGLHSAVSEYIADHGLNKKVISMGIPDRFIEQGTLQELYKECEYDSEDIYQKIFFQ